MATACHSNEVCKELADESVKTAVATVTGRTAILVKNAVGGESESDQEHFQVCPSSNYVVYKPCFFCSLPKIIFLMDRPWGRSEELTHAAWLFSSVACVLVSILAVQIVCRRFRIAILVSVIKVFNGHDHSGDGKADWRDGSNTVGVGGCREVERRVEEL